VTPEEGWQLRQLPSGSIARFSAANTSQLVSISGTTGTLRRDSEGRIVLTLPPASEGRRIRAILWQGPAEQLVAAETAINALAATPIDNPTVLAQSGPQHWPVLTTQGQRDADTDFLAVDTLTAPYDNPSKALFFFSGVDLTSDQTLYACTIHGDVWRVTGVNDSLQRLEWKRYATGLFQPLGLKVRNNEVFVLGRDRITRLQDLNHDGEADHYESFCDRIETSTEGHDYVTSLEVDNAGNFYYVDPKGVHKVTPDGRTMETVATGWRNPNGMGVSPDGKVITVAPQQGTWTPSSVISEVKVGGYYGYGGPKTSPARPLGYDTQLCWIPHSVDNSSGSQVWIPANTWGPLGGQLLHLLWGRSGMMLVLRDTVDGVQQGAVVPLPAKFQSGPNRATFNPVDGHLYVAGSTGWQTNARKDGSIHRVRYTAKPASLPIGWHVEPDALIVRFNQPVEKSTAEDPGSYGIKQWNYRYSQDYGSKDWSVQDPTREGRDNVDVKSATLLPDGRSVRLVIPGLKPVMQMEVKYNLDVVGGGKPMRGQFWLSINRVGVKEAR
jgi:glucose/arabinose dehydrogenase